jgi:acyl dehydratase
MSALEAGAALESRTFTVTREDLLRYAEASGDHNPIHSDEQVALSVGLPGVIAHGMFTMALVARAVAEWVPDAEVLELGCKFTSPVVVPADGGAEVEVAAGVKEVAPQGDTARVTLALVVTSGGQKVLGMPRAVLRVRQQ